MTMTAPIAVLEAPDMSVVTRKFVVREEMKTMTTVTAADCRIDAPTARRARSNGLDRAVRTLAVAMLSWSRRREARAAMNHSEHARRLQQRNAQLQREADTLRLTQRIGL
jgi:hypothetical protein